MDAPPGSVADPQAEGPVEVLLTIDDDTFSRLGAGARQLCVGMIDEPVLMRVLSCGPAHVAGETLGPARVCRLNRRWLSWLRTPAEEIEEMLDGRRPRIVHCLSARLARLCWDWTARWNAVLLCMVTDTCDIQHLGAITTAARIEVVTPTRRLAAAVAESYPALADRIRTIPLGTACAQEPACLARPDAVPSAIVTAALDRHGGLDHVLKALRMVAEAGHDLQTFLLGTGPAESSLRRLAERLELRSRVTFAGPITEIAALRAAMAAADFFILPSTRGRFRLDTLTAMGAGLVVLAPRRTLEDYLEDDRTALLFDEYRSSDLARRLCDLLEDRSAARRLAYAGLDHVRARHKASDMVAACSELYRRLA